MSRDLIRGAEIKELVLGLVFATQAPMGLHNRISGNATTQLFRSPASSRISATRRAARAGQRYGADPPARPA
jgi:hypothetical protein